MRVRREEDGSSGRYLYGADGEVPAKLEFIKPNANLVAIDHTEVPGVYRGQGIGLLMLEKAVEDARLNNFKIVPECSYAAEQFRRHPEWSDIFQQFDPSIKSS